MDENKKRILELIESGEIDVEEGVRRLESLAESEVIIEEPAAGAEAMDELIPPDTEPPSPPPLLVRIIWQAVFWTGVVMLIGGGLLVAAVYAWGVASGWLICGWPLFGVGVLVLLAGWWMRTARWFYVRVKSDKKGHNVFFAFPLPLGPIAWLLRILSPFIPQLKDTGLDELVMAMNEEVKDGQPLVIEVDEGENGEKVQVYFG